MGILIVSTFLEDSWTLPSNVEMKLYLLYNSYFIYEASVLANTCTYLQRITQNINVYNSIIHVKNITDNLEVHQRSDFKVAIHTTKYYTAMKMNKP